jgi:SulP family sulfate permease
VTAANAPVPAWLVSRLPGVRLALTYRREWLQPDLLSAVSVCAILIPQGMAYGNLAGVQPVAGLYCALAAMVTYALLGGSRHLITGPEAGSAILVASTLIPLMEGDTDPVRYAALAGLLAILTGAFLIVAGVFGLGFFADYLSKPVMVGYMIGVGFTIIASQMGKLFGLTIQSGNFFPQVFELLSRLPQTNVPTLVFGVSLILVMVLLRRFLPRVPAALVVVVLATVLVQYFDLTRYGISVVGTIPAGLPSLQIPFRGLADFGLLIPGALGLAVLIFPDSVLTARTFATRHGYAIDANQELIAVGANNVVAGLFQGFPNGSSSSRTTVNDAAGGQTAMVGLFGAGILALFLLFFTSLLTSLPDVALASIIIVSAAGLLDFGAVRRLYGLHHWAGILSIVTTLGVLAMGLVPGILVAVILSLFYVISKISRPHDAVLGRVEGVDGFHEIEAYENPETTPGLIVYRFDAQLFFANALYFQERVHLLVEDARESGAPTTCLLVDAEAMPTLDTTAAEMFGVLIDELAAQGICVAVARASAPLRATLERTGLLARIGPHRLFPSVRTGVAAFKQGRLKLDSVPTLSRC